MVSNSVGSILGVGVFLKKREQQKKRALKQNIEASLYTLDWGFKKIPFILYTFVLVEILQNGAKFRQKVTPGFKNHEEFGKLQPTSGRSKKLKFDGILLSRKYICPKNTFFRLKLYIQSRIYLKLLSTTCAKIHQISYVIFEIISHYSRHNLYVFFSAKTTYFLQKQSIKVHIFRLSTAQDIVHQIYHVIFQTKSLFFFKVQIFYQCYES